MEYCGETHTFTKSECAKNYHSRRNSTLENNNYLARQSVDTFQVGAEGEYYLGRFTFGAFAGIGSIRYANSVPFINTNPTRFVGRISADYYLLDDLRLGVSYINAFHDKVSVPMISRHGNCRLLSRR